MTLHETKQQLLDRMESNSYLSVRAPEDRQPVLAEVAALVADLPDPRRCAWVRFPARSPFAPASLARPSGRPPHAPLPFFMRLP